MEPIYFNKQQTKDLLPYSKLVPAIEQACLDYAKGEIISPNRLVTPIAKGVMLSMPASASDIAITKLINICPENPRIGLETINGQLIIWHPVTGIPQFILDAPTITAKRTAAVSMVGIKLFASNTSVFTIYGCGIQGLNHLEALASQYPNSTVYIIGSTIDKSIIFCKKHQHLPLKLEAAESVPPNVDVVITTTTSLTPVYKEPAQTDRLVIAVGVFQADRAEIASKTVKDSIIFVDDLPSAVHEAGDIIQAQINWDDVHSLEKALQIGVKRINKDNKPILFKSVGCAAWDLAACRVAQEILTTQSN